MFLNLIPELRIIFDESSVQTGIDINDKNISAWSDASGKLIAWSRVDDTGGWIYWNHLARFVYNKAEHFVTAYAPPQTGHDFIYQIYLENTLPFILSLRGYEVLHASAVFVPDGVIAFSAVSGTGKSTFVYTLQKRGYTVWADDVVIFRPKNGLFLCEPIPFNLRLYPETTAEVQKFHSTPPSNRNRSTSLGVEPTRLAAVCLLERIAEDPLPDQTTITRLPIQTAFTQLLPHAYNFEIKHPDRNRQVMITYLNLVSSIPIYKVYIPNRISALSPVLDQLETEILKGHDPI